MNTRDEWAALAEAFPELRELPPLTDEDIQRMSDEYWAEQIATAQSEAAEEAAQQEFRRGQ